MTRQKTEDRRQKTESGNLSSENGFTLVEVMIAMLVLLIGMLGVMSMQYFSISGNAASRELKIATNLGQEIIEHMKATPYLKLVGGTDLPTKGVAISGNVQFTRRWWVVSDCVGLKDNGNTCNAAAPACRPDSDPDGTMIVPVSVIRTRSCWPDKSGAVHSVTLDTLRWNENVTP